MEQRRDRNEVTELRTRKTAHRCMRAGGGG